MPYPSGGYGDLTLPKPSSKIGDIAITQLKPYPEMDVEP